MEVYLKYLVDHEEDRQLLINYEIGDIYCFYATKNITIHGWYRSEGCIIDKDKRTEHHIKVKLKENRRIYEVVLNGNGALVGYMPTFNSEYVYPSAQIEYFKSQIEELNTFLEIIQ